MPYTQLGLFIDGTWQQRQRRRAARTSSTRRPTKPLAHLPHATKADLDAALAAARQGFKVWRRSRPMTAASILKKAADLMRERADHIATRA